MDVLANLCGDSSRSHLKLQTLTCLFLVSALLLTSCKSESGGTQLATVEGASMFPVLPGNHFRLKCPECFFHFQIDADNVPKNKEAVCPNCGCDQVSIIATEKQTPGLLDLQPIAKPIRRWDIVAFRIPDKLKVGGGVGVKRVVGLPGETLSIVGGDILINGVVARRNAEIQKQMRIEINDSQFLPLNVLPRWVIDDGWMIIDRLMMYPTHNTFGEQRWLTYQHKSCYKHASDQESPDQIEDHYGCNQNVARSLNKIRDVAISADLTAASGAQVMFKMASGEEITEAMVDFSRSQVVVSKGNNHDIVSLDELELESPYRIEVSNFDGQVSVEINGVQIVQTDWELPQQRQEHAGLELKIGAARQAVGISRIRLWRDIYYFVDGGREASWTLGEDEYFLLGDNCPVSVDSRRFGPISGENIVGQLDLNRNQ